MQQIINVGTVPSDGTGDPIRTSFSKTNTNFTEVYSLISSNNKIRNAPIASVGQLGDVAGLIAIDSTYFYYCTATYDGLASIWKRQLLTGATW